MDFSFLKSGQDTLEDPNGADTVTERMVYMVIAMVAESAEAASVYSEHAGRSQVSEKDVAYGLMYLAKSFAHNTSILDGTVAQIEMDMDDSTDTASDDDEESTEADTASKDASTDEPWTRSLCECDACAGMNRCADTWADWIPENNVETFIKKAVDDAMSRSQSSGVCI